MIKEFYRKCRDILPYGMKNNAKGVRHAFGDDNNNNIDRAMFIQIDGEPSEMK